MISATGSYFVTSKELISVRYIDKHVQDKNNVIYEVLRFIDSKPLFLEDHIERFMSSFPVDNEKKAAWMLLITRRIRVLVEENKISYGNLRFQFNDNSPASFCAWMIPSKYPSKQQYFKGVTIKTYLGTRNKPNYKARNINLRRDVDNFIEENDIYEAILVNSKSFLTEGSRSNIFFIKDSILITPPLAMVLPGITRQKIIELIDTNNLQFEERLIRIEDMKNYSTCFISGTSPKILPVTRINDMKMDVENKHLINLISLFNQQIDEYIKMFKWDDD